MATRDQQIEALRQLFAGGLGPLTAEFTPGQGEAAAPTIGWQTPNTLAPLMRQARTVLGQNWNDKTLQWMSRLQGSDIATVNGAPLQLVNDDVNGTRYVGVGSQGEFLPFDPAAAAAAYKSPASFVLPSMVDPNDPNRRGRYYASVNPDGSIGDVNWQDTTNDDDWSFMDKLLMAGALAAIGYAAAPALFGGAGAPAAAAPIVESTPSWVAPGAMSTGTTGAATDLLAGTSLAGSTAAPMMSYIPGMEPITAQSLLAGGAGATVANGVTAADIAAAAGQPELGLATQAPVAPQSAAAAPISASQATTVASPFKMALDAVKPYASLIGPATSLLGAATAQAPQMPQNAGARIPGVEAPPEARGLDRQAARSPILDVLGRNRRENRNRTLLTGPGGVSMDSVRVAANTLLGM